MPTYATPTAWWGLRENETAVTAAYTVTSEDALVVADATGGAFSVTLPPSSGVPGIRVMHTPAHTDGGLTVFVETAGGTAAITGFCVIMENYEPPVNFKAMEMEVIPPGTHVNVYEAYDILVKVKEAADILLPLHEPRFAAVDTIP